MENKPLKALKVQIDNNIAKVRGLLKTGYQNTYFDIQNQLKILLFRLTDEKFIERIIKENNQIFIDQIEKAKPYQEVIERLIKDIEEYVELNNVYLGDVITFGKIGIEEFNIICPYLFQIAETNTSHDKIDYSKIASLPQIKGDNLNLNINENYIMWHYLLIKIITKDRYYFLYSKMADDLFMELSKGSNVIKPNHLIEFFTELGDYYNIIYNRKKAMECYRKAAHIAKENKDLESSAYSMQKYYRINSLFPSELQEKVDINKIREEYGEYANIINYGIKGSTLKVDPIEFIDNFSDIYCEAMVIVEEEINKVGDLHIPFQRWMLLQTILKDKYSIDWKTPKEMNPNFMFD